MITSIATKTRTNHTSESLQLATVDAMIFLSNSICKEMRLLMRERITMPFLDE